jgi:hypothetical protein
LALSFRVVPAFLPLLIPSAVFTWLRCLPPGPFCPFAFAFAFPLAFAFAFAFFFAFASPFSFPFALAASIGVVELRLGLGLVRCVHTVRILWLPSEHPVPPAARSKVSLGHCHPRMCIVHPIS